MDARMESTGGQPINWVEWSYIHKKVIDHISAIMNDSVIMLERLTFSTFQDKPMQWTAVCSCARWGICKVHHCHTGVM